MSIDRVYIHYPFCTKLCHYCNFSAGVSPKQEFFDIYQNALIKEIQHYQQQPFFPKKPLKSLYFGGGTPSLIPLNFLEKLLTFFPINHQTEITFEINPETVDVNNSYHWYQLGINRVSLGWQSMNLQTLQFLGRTSTPKDNIIAFQILRDVGFRNISVDRILSVHNDTDDDFFQTINTLRPEHISTYQLSIEKQTVLSLWTKQRKYLPLDDEKALAHEKITSDFLNSLGYSRYETSNYAQTGFEGQHNLGYWNYEHWLGLGAGASGFLPNNDFGLHYQNQFLFHDYCKTPLTYQESENIDKITALKEFLMLGLRKRSGINKKSLEKKLNVQWQEIFPTELNSEYFLETPTHLILKEEMIPLTNPAILDLWNFLEK